jgi:hypothetical protein
LWHDNGWAAGERDDFITPIAINSRPKIQKMTA